MALSERSSDLILRAQIDQALRPLGDVVQRVKDLTAVLLLQEQAAKSGDTTLAQYTKSLRDAEKAAGDLLRTRSLLEEFARRQQAVDERAAAVEEKRAALDAKIASSPAPDQRTGPQQTAIDRLASGVERLQKRAETATIAYAKIGDELQRLGVLSDNLAERDERLSAAHAQITRSVQEASQALASGQGQNDTLVATLRQANVEKQVAEQRQRDAARFLADQEAERRAVEATAAATREKGQAAQRASDLSDQTRGFAQGRGISREDVQAAFDADDAEKRLQADRAAGARAFQTSQRSLRQAVADVWEAEDAGAQKARSAVLAFQEAVQRTVGQASAARANASGQTAALGASVALPATPLATQVREALAPSPGPGAGLSDLDALQSEIAKIRAAIISGSGATRGFADELKRLDDIAKATLAQSQIIDAFQKQKRAAQDAALAFREAVAELVRLEEAAKTATPENLSEVTSAIAAKNRQIGSVALGTGLASKARDEIEALAQEEAALNRIGVDTGSVADAMTRLTGVAVNTSVARQAALAKEKAAIDALADAAVARARTISTTGAAGPRSAVADIAAVGGVGRGADIEDTSAAIDKLETTIGKAHVTAKVFNTQMDRLFAVQRQVASDAGLVDRFQAMQAAATGAGTAFNEAQADVIRLAAAVKAGTSDMRELVQAETTLNVATAALQKANAGLAQADAALRQRRIDTTNLTAETDKLVAATRRLAAIQAQAGSGRTSLFGLSTYQLENLSFQVNDVITQLSLGQGFLRTFESQAGQIFQVFETSITAMIRLVVYALPAAIAIGVLTLALLRLKDTIDTQREFGRLLAANADGLAYNAKQLTETARIIETFGTSFDDAKKAVKEFSHDGLSIESMLQFARTAQNLADVTGGDFAAALKDVGEISHGSLAEILKLNEQLNFLSASQAQAIRDDFEAGNAAAGRTIAINALTVSMERGRKEGIDPSTQAFRDLRTAWKEFLDAIGSTQLLIGLLGLLRDLAHGARDVATGLRLAFNPTVGDVDQRVMLLQGALKTVKGQIDAIKSGGVPGDEPLNLLERRARDLSEQLERALALQEKLKAPGASIGVTPAGLTEVTSGALTGRLSSLPGPDNRINKPIPSDIQPIIDAVSATIGVSVADMQALYRNEAARNADGSFQTSSAGARGPFQVLPGTFDETVRKFQSFFDALSKILGKKVDIDDPNFNALAGGLYFKQQLGDFGNNRLLAAGAYNAGPAGLRTMLAGGGSDNGVKETSQYIANFASTPGPSGVGLPGFQRNPNTTNQDAVRNAAVLDDITKRQAQDVDDLLRGDDRILSDQRRLSEYYKQRNTEIDQQLQTSPRSPELTAAFNREIDQFAKKLEDARIRQIDAANNATLQIVKQAQLQVDKADKTNAAAQRRAVDEEFAARLSALDEQIAHGADDVLKGQLDTAKNALLKLRDTAREQASVAADRAIVDDTVKARDDLVKEIENGLKAGTLTLQEAFRRLQLIVSQFKPQIEAGVARSNADLTRQPQTPAVQAQIAKNAAIDTTGRAATEQVDTVAQAHINDLLAARATKVKEINEQVANGTKTQRQADSEILAAYQQFAPKLNVLTDELQKQIDTQRDVGQISEETYEKMSAAIQKAKTSNDDLTASLRKFIDSVEQSITGHAIQAFDTITTSIGNAIAGTGKWTDVIKATGVAFAQFAAGVLKDLAAMVIKQQLMNALQSGSGAIGGIGSFLGIGGAAAGAAAAGGTGSIATTAISSGLYHTGGLVGLMGISRAIDPSVFARAPRAHAGGLPGLAPGEVPIVAQTGEEVLASDNPRHRNNFQKTTAGTTPQSIKNVLLFDDAEVAGAMAGASGEAVTLTHLKRNAPAVRQLLGIK